MTQKTHRRFLGRPKPTGEVMPAEVWLRRFWRVYRSERNGGQRDLEERWSQDQRGYYRPHRFIDPRRIATVVFVR